jgi:hypothetical protein
MNFLVMNYDEREITKMDEAEQEEIAVEYSHWHRFLMDIYGTSTSNELFLPFDVQPSFEMYRSWVFDYPGWSHGKMNDKHSCWKKHYKGIKHPMNYFYENRVRLRKEVNDG